MQVLQGTMRRSTDRAPHSSWQNMQIQTSAWQTCCAWIVETLALCKSACHGLFPRSVCPDLSLQLSMTDIDVPAQLRRIKSFGTKAVSSHCRFRRSGRPCFDRPWEGAPGRLGAPLLEAVCHVPELRCWPAACALSSCRPARLLPEWHTFNLTSSRSCDQALNAPAGVTITATTPQEVLHPSPAIDFSVHRVAASPGGRYLAIWGYRQEQVSKVQKTSLKAFYELKSRGFPHIAMHTTQICPLACKSTGSLA